MWNTLIHEYFGVNLKVVWRIPGTPYEWHCRL
jgi:uncharacterized protein with HEPN domain